MTTDRFKESMGGKLEEVSVLVYKLEALRRQDTLIATISICTYWTISEAKRSL